MEDEILEYLKNKGINYIKTKKNTNLYKEIDGHPDIVSCRIKDKVILENDTFEYLNKMNLFDNIIKGESILNSKYPNDIYYNVVITEKYIIGNLKYTESIILHEAQKNNLKMIDVKQGYARCSTLILNDDTFMTSDKNIHKNLIKSGIKSYYIDIDDIYLSERYNGFLGGASVNLGDEILFFGDIKKSKSFSKIDQILNENKIQYSCLNFRLRDYGSMIRLY